ncbi:MAG: sigma-70 family RNA polymerase sigma factor [Chitinispirillaceae bacterium]|nr:sigma-70 family RNA polymerase sigma factor [Chitinispirillaceae bacterium]
MDDIDRITVEMAKKGDHKAFRRIYDHYAPFVWRVAYRTAGSDRNLGGEIVQQTFINIHRSIRKFSGGSALSTWIYRIAFNASQSLLAKRARMKKDLTGYDDEIHGGGFRADGYEVKELVDKVLAALESEDRFLLVAREIDNLSFDEIAAITGKTSESLRIRMFRLKEKIVSRNIGTEPEKEMAV